MVRRSVWDRIISLLYPERCCCCGKPVRCGGLVCDSCRPKLMTVMPPLCPACGCSVKDCRCGRKKRHTDRCISAFYYEGSAKNALFRLKFSGKIYAAELFIEYMTEKVKSEYSGIPFDCIVPVPLSPGVHRKRRYNQSELLSKGLAEKLGIPCTKLLVKLRETTPQRELPAFRRSGNVLGVFDVAKGEEIHIKPTILLVDDTVTTGATLDECAKILKLYGADSVFAVTATASRLPDQES